MLDALKDKVSDAADAVGDAADAVSNAVGGTACDAAFKLAEAEIEKEAGKKIEVVSGKIPASWIPWICKTGVNSLCTPGTWSFLDKNPCNARKIELWNERNIDKIVISVNEEPDEEDQWVTCMPEWEEGSTTLTLVWYPRAGRWESSAAWNESGYKRWWNLCDEIVFGLQLYQLPGKCFYKSDWLDGVEDPDEESPLPFGTKKYKRWFQFRHWIMYWYARERWGWNWQWTEKPPALPDGSDFDLSSVLSLPDMPDFSMPAVRLPALPDFPDVSMPSMPDVSLPDAPSLSAPSLSAPSLGSLPSMPDKKKRPKGRWACHGFMELTDMKCKAKGKTLVLSNVTVTHFWQQGEGWGVENEKKEHQRFELDTTSDAQAESWVETLKASGVEEGEVGGCCTVA